MKDEINQKITELQEAMLEMARLSEESVKVELKRQKAQKRLNLARAEVSAIKFI